MASILQRITDSPHWLSTLAPGPTSRTAQGPVDGSTLESAASLTRRSHKSVITDPLSLRLRKSAERRVLEAPRRGGRRNASSSPSPARAHRRIAHPDVDRHAACNVAPAARARPTVLPEGDPDAVSRKLHRTRVGI